MGHREPRSLLFRTSANTPHCLLHREPVSDAPNANHSIPISSIHTTYLPLHLNRSQERLRLQFPQLRVLPSPNHQLVMRSAFQNRRVIHVPIQQHDFFSPSSGVAKWLSVRVMSHAQDKVSRFGELPKPVGREDHRFLSSQFSNPREQV